MYVLRETTQLSQKAIGAEFSGRDHTTVIYAVDTVKKSLVDDKQRKRVIADIIKNIRATW